MPAAHSLAAATNRPATLTRALVVCVMTIGILSLGGIHRIAASGADHLVLSELMTGGTSASDELIELYNPSSSALPLEGLELVYITASGATVTRRASWDVGAPHVPPGGHILVANELGIFASIADALYAGGMAATGGSVALRIQGAASAIDAVGWGTAASNWLEGLPAAAPPAGASLERLPGGTAGSTLDTDDNAADFTVRSVPDPQNSGSPPVPDPTQPSQPPSPTPSDTPGPTPTPTSAASATPGPTTTPWPAPVAIATARALADGTAVTVEGDALSASDFTDGGGYLADATGGIAVLLADGSFARGDRVLVTGILDDRFAQRTIRADAGGHLVTGTGVGPAPLAATTGAVDETVEGRLVRISGTIDGGATTLTGGLAFDVDDGSGAVRVILGTGTGIESSGWADGVGVSVVGVVGQRDSTGTGSSGYRVQPRVPVDVQLGGAPTPGPSAGESPDPEPTSTPSPGGDVVSIATARAAPKNARVTVRGVVTLSSGTVDPESAVIQDGSGAILLRLGDEAGSVSRGQLLEVAGTRSTKSGMESLRVSVPPRRLGSAAEPAAQALRSGQAAEATEARLVIVRGAVVASARRASSGTVSFEIDDGSGPLRVVLGASLEADDESFAAGTWIEVRGVLGQETTGAQPTRGYRIWPRNSADLRVLATATAATGGTQGAAAGADGGGASAADASLEALGDADLADLRVGATLVAAAWPELGVAGLLWDGTRLVAIAPASAPRVTSVLEDRATPLALELLGLRRLGEEPRAGMGLVVLGEGAGDTVVGSAAPAPPSTAVPGADDAPSWVSLVGSVTDRDGQATIEIDGTPVVVERLCRRAGRLPDTALSLVGVGLADPPRVLVGCDGVRAAPALGHLSTVVGGEADPGGADALVAEDASPTSGRRLLGAGLLASGVVILLLAVVLARRLGTNDSALETPREPPGEDEGAEAPQLTLVRLPNEQGP